MPVTQRSSDDYDARLDDAIHEINQRWGEPIGGEDDPIDMALMDQELVRETAEAVIAPWKAQAERLRGERDELADLLTEGVRQDYGTPGWRARAIKAGCLLDKDRYGA